MLAADMWFTKFKKDPFDTTVFDEYKKSVLVPGASRDELYSIEVRYGTMLHPCAIGINNMHQEELGGRAQSKKNNRQSFERRVLPRRLKSSRL